MPLSFVKSPQSAGYFVNMAGQRVGSVKRKAGKWVSTASGRKRGSVKSVNATRTGSTRLGAALNARRALLVKLGRLDSGAQYRRKAGRGERRYY